MAATDKNKAAPTDVDRLVDSLHTHSATHRQAVQSYWAGTYTKVHLDIKSRNFILRHIPSLFRSERDVNEYLLEMFSRVHYTAPNIYDQKVELLSGTLRDDRSLPGLTNYFNINIYSPFLIKQQLLSPLASNGRKHYTYRLDSVSRSAEGHDEYHIGFTPKNKSHQLVSGYMTVSSRTWTVRSFTFTGKAELLHFSCRIQMGEEGEKTETLPVQYNVDVGFKFLRNHIKGHYESKTDYKDIQLRDTIPITQTKRLNALQQTLWPAEQQSPGRKRDYNLTASYSLKCNPSAFRHTPEVFDSLRPIPLTIPESRLYLAYMARQDSLKHLPPQKASRKSRFWQRAEDILIADYKWQMADHGVIRSPAFLNPMLFSYSKSNGIAYRLDLRYTEYLRNDMHLNLRTKLGYNFTRKEFYWSVNTDFTYYPERNGKVVFNVGNGNRIYSSEVLESLKKIPDSTFNFDRLNLEYFNDLHIQVGNSIELCRGLTLEAGINMHRRTPIKRPHFQAAPDKNTQEIEQLLSSQIKKHYTSFAPHMRLTWSPGQYYYMNGRRKVNLLSRYPTLSLDYERGLRNVWQSSGTYERIEFDLQHRIRLGLMSTLFYRFGTGLFTNQHEAYFVDFENFRRNNLPVAWNDEIGGVFQALDGRWYNSSRHYVRVHFTYEAPFLVLRHLMKYTGYVQNERAYLNVLSMPHLRPYVELGYGIGTHIFDAGAFVSVRNYNKFGFGFKFTFELFRD